MTIRKAPKSKVRLPAPQPEIRHVHFDRKPPVRAWHVNLAAARLAVLAVAVFSAAIVAAIHYEAQFARINWRLVALICGAAGAVGCIYWWQSRPNNTYDVVDLVSTRGHADLGKHLTLASFGLAAWVLVQQALTGKPVETLALGILAIFVAKETANGFSSAMRDRPATQQVDQSVNVLEGANVAPKTTAANP